ncbi:MAG: hypothetical protein JNL45_17080 [Hyphomicrobium sp.]|jgi:flagellar motor switch protein FliG|nr:hypothetical protein [Hyphomicrobium sp.]
MSAPVERLVLQEHLSELDGATKAALLLLAVNRDKAVELLKRLDAGEVKLIAQGAERLGAVTPDLLAGVIANFRMTFEDGIKFLGTTDEVRKLIVEAVGQEAIADQPAPDTPVSEIPADLWSYVGQLSIEELKSYTVAQHPQVAAFILSRVDPDQVAALMQELDMDLCSDLLTRMLPKAEPAVEIVQAIERAMVADLMKESAGRSGQGRAELASVLNRLDRARASNVISRLHEQSPADAKAVERMLFRFEDLAHLPAKSLTAVVEQMPVDQLVLALNGADSEFTAAVLGVMPARGRRMAESELQNGAEASPKAIAAARKAAVDTVLRMVASGAIELVS